MPEPTTIQVPCDLCGAPPVEPFLEKHGLWYSRCPECDFVYANPRLAHPETYNSENNQKLLESYARKHFSGKNKAAFRSVLRQLAPYRKEGHLLEIGCSVGGFLHEAKQLGWQPVGVEPVSEVAQYGIEHHQLDIRASILEEAELPENHFDVIYGNAVVEHLPSPTSVLQEAARVLRPGGAILLDTVNLASYTWERLGKDWRLVDPRAHLGLFSPATLRRYCEKVGLVPTKLMSHGVRLRPNHAKKISGVAKIMEELHKAPLSLMTRFNLKGDSIAILATKPTTAAHS